MTKAFALNVSMKALFFVCSGIGKRPSKLVRQPLYFQKNRGTDFVDTRNLINFAICWIGGTGKDILR